MSGGVQDQEPPDLTVEVPETGSDSTVIVICVPEGPSPKNSGFWVLTTSPCFTLSKVTDFCSMVISSSVLKADSFCLISSGISSVASGFIPAPVSVRFLKSWVSPSIIVGVGLANIAKICADEVP